MQKTHNSFLFLSLFLLSMLVPARTSNAGVGYLNSLPAALQDPQENKNHAADFQLNIQEMAVKLFKNLEDPDPVIGLLADGIAVSTFVDLKKLNRTSSFGRYIAEQLMTEFQQHGYIVKDIRKSSSISVQKKHGEFGLSRDINEIGKTMEARTLITGTYTQAGDHIMVNAKILDNKDSSLLSSATMVFPANSLTNLLLSDSSSASSHKNEVVYMKEMEL